MANPAPGFVRKPEHRVDLHPDSHRVRVTYAGKVVADTTEALRVEETGHDPVYYVPEKDMRMELLKPTDHKTHCPFKGDASYWTIDAGAGDRAENAVWGYPTPFDEVIGLAGHYAFYNTRVDAIDVS